MSHVNEMVANKCNDKIMEVKNKFVHSTCRTAYKISKLSNTM